MRYKFLLFISLLIILTALGCKKSKQNKLTGSWRLLPVTADQQDIKVVFKFDSENVLYRFTDDTIIDTADYELKEDFFKYYLTIKNLDYYNDYKYYIEKINRKILILQSQSPYLRKEFSRLDE